MQHDTENEWVRLAHAIPWDKMEVKYAALFPSRTGHPATPLRMALGILIIQKRKKLSDRAVIKEIQENPYLQYFIGMDKFSHEPPVKPTVLVNFRKRLTADFLMEGNEYILERAGTTEEHREKNESRNAKAANTPSKDIENLGTEIPDATCSPSNIRINQKLGSQVILLTWGDYCEISHRSTIQVGIMKSGSNNKSKQHYYSFKIGKGVIVRGIM